MTHALGNSVIQWIIDRAQGYPIGLGTMENACKQIGLAPLKIAGARWSHDGARLVAKARAAYLSSRWDEVCAQVA